MIVLAVAAVILIASRDPASKNVSDADRQINLTELVNTSVDAVFTQEGEIKGESEHDSVRITVNRNQRRIEHFRGYDGRVLRTETYSNTQEAFDHFLHALKNTGFSAAQEPKYESHKGVCPFGNRYIYELLDSGQRVMRLWSTTCRDQDGNFAGEENQVRKLFQNQIPEYREFARDIDL